MCQVSTLASQLWSLLIWSGRIYKDGCISKFPKFSNSSTAKVRHNTWCKTKILASTTQKNFRRKAWKAFNLKLWEACSCPPWIKCLTFTLQVGSYPSARVGFKWCLLPWNSCEFIVVNLKTWTWCWLENHGNEIHRMPGAGGNPLLHYRKQDDLLSRTCPMWWIEKSESANPPITTQYVSQWHTDICGTLQPERGWISRCFYLLKPWENEGVPRWLDLHWERSS